MTYAVGFSGFITVEASSPAEALAEARHHVVVTQRVALDWDEASPYSECDMPECSRPAVITGGGERDRETGYAEEINVCKVHR